MPVGDAGFQLYSLATPNGVKVTLMLEELLEMQRNKTMVKEQGKIKLDVQKTLYFLNERMRF